tara:strand:- start:452 stop:691 length:240 start_codon:yes stop_codon:yes gene_type:complete
MARNRKEIIYFLANKYDIPLKQVEKVVNSQFKYAAIVMKHGNFATVKLPYFGKFTVNENRVKYITKLKNESTRRSNNNK